MFVYIEEAHAADEWQMPVNEREGVVCKQPTALAERQAVAARCNTALGLSMPCVVDTIDNTTDERYAGWPERIFIVDEQGKIAYAGKSGPWGFKPREAEARLKRHARSRTPP